MSDPITLVIALRRQVRVLKWLVALNLVFASFLVGWQLAVLHPWRLDNRALLVEIRDGVRECAR